MTKFGKSIHWNLLLWQMLLLSAVLSTLLYLHYHLHRKSLLAEVDGRLVKQLSETIPSIVPKSPPNKGAPWQRNNKIGSAQLGGPPGHPGHPNPRLTPGSEALKDFEEKLKEENQYIMIWDSDGSLQNHFGIASGFKEMPEGTEGSRFNHRNGFREMVHHHDRNDQIIVIGYDMAVINSELRNKYHTLIVIGGSIFLIALAGGWLIIRQALQPIHQISQTAEEITKGDHSSRIQLASAPLEMTSLAKTLNNSFDHLDSAIETQKRFIADASHELRTPIAVIIAQTQAALKRDREKDEYKGILEACLRAGQRMKAMANSLLDLTSIDGHQTLELKQQCFNQLVVYTVNEISQLSENHPIQVDRSEEPLTIDMDAERMHQVLTNLFTNAIQHNPAGCPIYVTTKRTNNEALLEITDEGSGIPAESLPFIFDRFYRVDQARSREQGGAGLGLSIVKSIIESHNGTIKVSSKESCFTTFTIKLSLCIQSNEQNKR